MNGVTIAPTNPLARGRNLILVLLSGCAGLMLCALFACTANAVYWINFNRAARVARAPENFAARVEPDALPAGNATNGEQVFSSNGCSACHSLVPNERKAGPTLAGIAARAAIIKPGYSARQYIYESIVNPNAYLVPGFPSGIMPAGFERRLNQQQIADLLAFLLTQ